MSQEKLKIIIFYGSTREGRLVERVGAHVESAVKAQGMEPEIFDPEKLPLEPLKKAFHFYAKPTDAPEWMQEAYEKITKADGFIIVTPEYNGGIPAALSNMLDHFSPWSYRHRPVGIVTYSIGPFGGVRVTVQIRSYAAEFGMLPIPTNVIIPDAHLAFEADGTCKVERTAKKVATMVTEVKWYALAIKDRRKLEAPPGFVPYYAELLDEFSK